MTNIHPSAVIDESAVLEEGVVVGPHCVVEAGVTVGAGTVLDAGAVLRSRITLGRDNHIHAHSVIGDTPQVLDCKPIEELGTLIMGDGNVVREHVTLHRSMYPGKATGIGNGNLFMAASHVAHDCHLEDHVVMCNACLLGGHCKVETGAWMSGMAAAQQFTTIGKWVYIAAKTAVIHDVPPFLVMSGNYPTRIRGVNERGVQRAGLDEAAGRRLIEAFQKLYRQEGPLLENARRLAAQDGLDENVRSIIESIERSSRHRFGRYLETFR